MKKKKFTFIILITLLIIIFISLLLQPTSPTTFNKECILDSCDCQCYLKGKITQQESVTVCKTDCKQLFNIVGCEYVGIQCPYGITGCAIVDALNDLFISKQCEIVKGK